MKSIADGYRRRMRTAAMDVVRAAAGVSDSGEKVSVSLTASAGTTMSLVLADGGQ